MSSAHRAERSRGRSWARRRWRPGDSVRLGGVEYRHLRLLKADIFSENHLLEAADRSTWVAKIARPVPSLAERERRVYARAAGIPGIPDLGPVHGPDWFLHRFVPGRSFGEHVAARYEEERCVLEGLAPDFFGRLEAIVRELHARGIACLDIGKKANVIVTPDGEPALIDFQIALTLPSPRGPLLDRVFRVFAESDLFHVRKHRHRYAASRGDREQRLRERARRDRDRPLALTLHRLLVRPLWLPLKRRIVPAEPE